MKGLNRAAAVFLAGAAMVAIPAQAQQAGIQISVVDAVSGAPAADTEVVIENPGTGFRRVARTDAQGLLRLEGLTTSGQFRKFVEQTRLVTTAERAGGGQIYENGWARKPGWIWSATRRRVRSVSPSVAP
jgi:hypothetical protein